MLFDVVGIGAYCLDTLAVTDGYPAEDEKTEVEDITVQGGGNVATALVAVARLGGHACYHGIVADDENTGVILDGLKREGIDAHYIKVVKGRNPFAFIIINKRNSSRTIMFTKKDVPGVSKEEVDLSVVENSKVVLLDFYFEEASVRASEIAKSKRIPVVIDAERVTPLCSDIMQNASHIIASKSFSYAFTEESVNTDINTILEKFSKKIKSPFICITLGDQGSVCIERNSGKKYFQPAFHVSVADTTGAGDVFHGAFCFFLSKGYEISEILRYSSACSALACRAIGGRKSIPFMNELISFLHE